MANQNSFTLRKAERQQTKLRLGISGVSGAGKTLSALLLAKGLVNNWTKIAVIDTENGSADLYSHLGEYNVITLTAPFNPERYIECIKACENAGMECIIIDSISHEWEGVGGCIEIHTKLGGQFNNWKQVSPRHKAFIDAILGSDCHIITTVRKKQDYVMEINEKGKQAPVKVGLKEITRDGFEYELTVNFEISMNHFASTSKDRTGLFAGKPDFNITEETGEMLKDWCNKGIIINQELVDKIKEASTREELLALKKEYPNEFQTFYFKNLANTKYHELEPISN